MILTSLLFIVLLLDLACGDPRWFPHPVRLIGRVILSVESIVRKAAPTISLKICGTITFFVVLFSCGFFAWFGLFILEKLGGYYVVAGSILILYFCVAAGDLLRHSRRVYSALNNKDVLQARKTVAMLVGRDTDNLNENDISRACVESVAENLVDGITAPLFWATIGYMVFQTNSLVPITFAAVAAFMYKAINTMDSMIGYRNEKYREFGWFAARSDDIVNFIPARLTGLCVIVAAFFVRLNHQKSYEIFHRDRLKSSSPNSGHTEAAAAGALGIQLGGGSSYFGQLIEKPIIAEGLRLAEPVDILRVNRLVIASTIIFILCLSFLNGSLYILTK